MSEIRHQSIAPSETRVLASGADVDPHRHDDHQIIYASSGVLEVVAAHGKWFTPSSRAVWVPANTVHVWQVHGLATVHLVGIPVPKAPDIGADPALLLVTPLFRELVIAGAGQGSPATPAQRRLVQVLIDQVQRITDRASMLPALHDPRLQRVQAILESDLTRSPSLDQLGRQIGASARTLTRLFNDELGMSFTVWRTQLRLHRASLLLAQGNNVTQVAAEAGFSSPSAFISAFRAAFGRTPGSLYK